MPEPDPLDPLAHIERWGDDSPAESLIEALKICLLWRHWGNKSRYD
jgi:hypothetical protein